MALFGLPLCGGWCGRLLKSGIPARIFKRVIKSSDIEKGTLAAHLGVPCHVSPLLAKMRRLGFPTSRAFAALAVARGCHHYAAFADPDIAVNTVKSAEISDEELAIALLSPANPYDPMLIRIGSQMLSGPKCDPSKLVRLAIQERCTSILKGIAECGKVTEPHEPLWARILERLPICQSIPSGVLPHPSRFRIETGILHPKRHDDVRVRWLRPTLT